MPESTSTKPACPICGERFRFPAKRHQVCERRVLLQHLNASGLLAENRRFYLSQPGWKSCDRAPVMYTMNGVGTTLYRRRDEHTISRTATVTLYAALLFIPLFPIGVYRVAVLGDQHYAFLAKHPPELSDWIRVGKVWLCVVVGFGLLKLFLPR